MNLTAFLLAHLAANPSRVPYDAEELRQAYWGQGGKGQPTLMDIADAMAELVRQGRARVDGDGWCYVVPRAKEERTLF